MDRVVIVHVTDVHLKSNGDEPNRRARLVGSTLAQSFDTRSNVIIVLGGDTANAAKPEQYDLAKQFVGILRQSMLTAGFSNPAVVVAPGNHDCDYSLQDENERLALWTAAQDLTKTASMFRSLSTVQAAYHAWVKEVATPSEELAPTLTRTCISMPSGQFCLDALNTSWSSVIDKREGHLAFCELEIPRLDDGAVALLIAHHPPNWFQQDHKIALQRWIDENYDIVFYGHEHFNEELDRRSRHTGAAISIVAGSAFYSGERSADDGFAAIAFEGKSPYQTKQATYRWSADKFVLQGQVTEREFVSNPAKARPRRSFKKQFLVELEDPGMQLNHPAVTRPIRLSELFVEPRLLLNVPSRSAEADPATAVPASSLLRRTEPAQKSVALVFSPEQSGKSTLCKFLCSRGQSDGLVPLWLSVSALQSNNSGEVTAWINKAIVETYTGEADVFYQADLATRVILLDGLERLRGGSATKLALIDRCSTLAGQVIVLMSASSATEGLVLLGRGERKLPDADIYELVSLSKQAIHELLKRWYSLGASDSERVDGDVDARCRQLTTRMSSLLGRHGLPPFPISVLLLLQLTEAMRESDAIVADGSFGYIMDSLIVTEMQRARVSVSLSIAVGYLAEFAWFLESKAVLSVDEEIYSTFHRSFESTHGLTVHERQIKQDLADARFLTVEPGSIRFRYAYLFHFFLAKHLAAIYNLEEGQALVANLVRYVHTDKAASVLTFLAHFSAESDLVRRLLAKADAIHGGSRAVDFWRESSMFARFNSIEGKETLISYDSPDADSEISDEELASDVALEGELSQQEMFPAEDDPLGWTSALKLIHVLGQVLRSRSTRMTAAGKAEVVAACIKVARKTLGFAFAELERDAPALVRTASGAFEKLLLVNRDKAARQASSFLGWLVVALSCTYLFRVGRACGADEFMALNADLFSSSKDPNDRLFLLCARVLGERVLVEGELLNMYDDSVRSDLLPVAIIRRLARYRLHLSPPEETQRRRVARKMQLGNSAALIARNKLAD